MVTSSLVGIYMLFMLWLTFFFGAILYFLGARLLIVIAAIILSAGIVLSFVFAVGEVYIYSDTYRRAFFVFGDSVTTLLIFGFLYAFATKKKWLSALTLTAIWMSGGRISFLLLLIMMAVFILLKQHGKERLILTAQFSGLALGCVLVYVALTQASLQLMERPLFLSLREHIKQVIGHDYALADHRTACYELSLSDCIEEQSERAILQRYYSSLGGLWMTLEGGYRGQRYPNSKEKFADLMVAANPWGMNDRYMLTRTQWLRIGAVQNPYLRFGSGYGLWLMLAQVGVFLVIGYLAWRNLAKGERDEGSIFSIYFIVLILFNQTQPWLVSMSWILVLLGLCASHIVVTWLLRRNQIPSFWQPFWERHLVVR
jgi:hypothetical protein